MSSSAIGARVCENMAARSDVTIFERGADRKPLRRQRNASAEPRPSSPKGARLQEHRPATGQLVDIGCAAVFPTARSIVSPRSTNDQNVPREREHRAEQVVVRDLGFFDGIRLDPAAGSASNMCTIREIALLFRPPPCRLQFDSQKCATFRSKTRRSCSSRGRGRRERGK